LLSDDNGTTWHQAKVPVSVSLTNVRFATDAKGLGGRAQRRRSAQRLTAERLGPVNLAAHRRLRWCSMRFGQKPLRQGVEAVRKELAEAERLVADGPDKPFLDVYFSDENHGLGRRRLRARLCQEDGGEHWQPCRTVSPIRRSTSTASTLPAMDSLSRVSRGALFRSTTVGNSFANVNILIRVPISGHSAVRLANCCYSGSAAMPTGRATPARAGRRSKAAATLR